MSLEKAPNPYTPPSTQSHSGPSLSGSNEFMPCPACGDERAKKISFTFWGGLVGPRLMNHVRCTGCLQTFNGKTGRSNSTAIAIYISITFVFAIIFVLSTLLYNYNMLTP